MSLLKKYNSQIEDSLKDYNKQLEELKKEEQQVEKMTPQKYEELYKKAESLDIVPTPHNIEHNKYAQNEQTGTMGYIIFGALVVCAFIAMMVRKKHKATRREIQRQTDAVLTTLNQRFTDATKDVVSDEVIQKELEELKELKQVAKRLEEELLGKNE